MIEAFIDLRELSSWLLLASAVLYIMVISESRFSKRYFTAGLVLHALNFLKRGLDLGWVPLAEKHDTISFMGFSLALCLVYTDRKTRNDRVLLFGAPLVVGFLIISFLSRRQDDISPFLDSAWFFLHSFTYFGSFGFLGAGMLLGGLYLYTREALLEQMQYRMLLYGWMFYTVALVLGSIWFFVAYGTYWLWTSKELWSTLTWFYLGMYAHARLMPRFRGWPATAMGTLGYVFALFTYFGVGTLIPSPPTVF